MLTAKYDFKMLQLICFRSKYITGASIEVAGGLGVWNSSNATLMFRVTHKGWDCKDDLKLIT